MGHDPIGAMKECHRSADVPESQRSAAFGRDCAQPYLSSIADHAGMPTMVLYSSKETPLPTRLNSPEAISASASCMVLVKRMSSEMPLITSRKPSSSSIA